MKHLKPLGNDIQMSLPPENRFGGAAKVTETEEKTPEEHHG